jgi:hypothetical protein
MFVFSAFEPVRMNIQGDVIRDLDKSHTQARRHERADSDDDEQHAHTASNGRSTMNIYIERQKKRVKLSTTAMHASELSTSSMLT